MKLPGRQLGCLILTGALLLTSVSPAFATDLQQQINDAESQGAALASQKDEAQQKIDSLSSQLDSVKAEITTTEASITSKNDEIETAEEEYTQAKIVEENQYEAMKLRIKYMYEYGSGRLITVLLEASDMSDFLNKAEYVQQLSSYDRNKLIEFQETRAEVERQEAKLQQEYEELTALKSDLETKQADVQSLVAQQETLLNQLTASLGENAELVSGLRTKLAAYNEQVAAAAKAAQAAQAEQAAQAAAQVSVSTSSGSSSSSSSSSSSVVSGSGQFVNPCPSGYLSSGFGYRTYDNSFHKGIDLACSAGNPIYAAASGTVIIAGYSASAGNWVVINHGNGLVTKYMHASALYVSAGQTVSAGQQIAAVGSTGNSSGNHLHFQVEVNGTAVNPYLYL